MPTIVTPGDEQTREAAVVSMPPPERGPVVVRSQSAELRERLEEYTRAQPVEALVLALVAGVLTGTMLRGMWHALTPESRRC